VPNVLKSGEIIMGKGLEFYSFAEIDAYKDFIERLELDKLTENEKLLIPFIVKDKFFPKGITDSFALETLDFLRAIWDDKNMEVSGREGLKDMALSYAVIESSILNRPVKPEEIESGKISNYEKEINDYYLI
jgi:hypothetical protein